MAERIGVRYKEGIRDSLGEKIKRRIREHLFIDVQQVRTADIYTIDGALSPDNLQKAAHGPLSDPIVQNSAINRPCFDRFDWLIEVGYRPGVTDNIGRTAREALALLFQKKTTAFPPVHTSRQYAINGDLTQEDANRIARDLLANELIERFVVLRGDTSDWQTLVYVPRVDSISHFQVTSIDLDVSNDQLMAISSERVLALNLEEMQTIRDYIKSGDILSRRKEYGLDGQVTDAELECLAQTWSEHCKHKIFNSFIDYEDEKGNHEEIHSLFDSFIRKSTRVIREQLGPRDWCLSVFIDNAGIIHFNDQYNMVFKVETHNSPSALDPYGGALTGIVGVNRDPFGTGLGAKLIFNTDVFCFASPYYDRPLPPRILHPRRIYEGVREGVEHGGNKSGIPTINGCIVFDDRYLGKPLVYCGTAGIMPSRLPDGRETHKREIHPGDLVVMAGGRVGKDGIHGATFSSEELHEDSPVTAVQIGDPITQKKMTDFLLMARDQGLYRCITDNGAGGLSSSVGETATLSGGCELDLEKVPLKYTGLNPWEILISESQERMTLAIDPQKIHTFLALAEKMDCEATVIGHYTNSGWFHIRYGSRTVVCLEMDFLHKGLPPMRLQAKWYPHVHEEPSFPVLDNLGDALKAMLGRLNICSKESVIRQYDHEVQGGSIIKPLVGEMNDGPGDGAVIRPLLDSFEGIVVANGICPRYSDIDTYHMAACTIDEAVRNAIAVGGSLDELAGLDNFCWCDPVQSEKTPDGQYKLGQLVRANQALYDVTTVYGVPCISGKDSMKNDYQIGYTKISIPPTLLFSTIGKVEDVRKTVTMDAKRPGDFVYILGKTRKELGGSEWYALHGFVGNTVPKVDAHSAKERYIRLSKAISAGLVASCHDCADGGLAVALAETSFAGGLGVRLNADLVPAEGEMRIDELLFSESQSRFVVTVSQDRAEDFEKAMADTIFAKSGYVTAEPMFIIEDEAGKQIIKENLADLKQAWQVPLNF